MLCVNLHLHRAAVEVDVGLVGSLRAEVQREESQGSSLRSLFFKSYFMFDVFLVGVFAFFRSFCILSFIWICVFF